MAEAEPVIWPCSRTPTCRPPSAAATSPSCTDLLRIWARSSTPVPPLMPTVSPASSAIPRSGRRPRPVADPGAVEGARVRPGRPHRPTSVRHRHRRSGRPLCRDDPSDPATRHPHEPLTAAKASTVPGVHIAAHRQRGQHSYRRGRRACLVGDLRSDDDDAADIGDPIGDQVPDCAAVHVHGHCDLRGLGLRHGFRELSRLHTRARRR